MLYVTFKKLFKWVLNLGILGAFLLFYNNCAGGFQQVPLDSSEQSSEAGPPSSNGDDHSWISLQDQGTNDPGCMANSKYDACIFYKNPFVQSYIQRNTGLSGLLVSGMDLSALQIFSVELKNRVSLNSLESGSHKIVRGQASLTQSKPIEIATTIPAQIKIPYALDTNYLTSMSHSYFWTEKLQEQLTLRTGLYYAAGKKVEIFMLGPSDGVINNAYWGGFDDLASVKRNWISMGIVNRGRSGKFYEIGLDSEILLHEMGHANFAFAKGYPAYDIFADNFSYVACMSATGSDCTSYALICGSATSLAVDSNLGCQSAINEGLADFFYLMMFPQFPTIWETSYNSLSGVSYRDMRTAVNKTVKQFVNSQICDIAASTSTVPGSTACQNGAGLPGVVRDYAEIHQLGAAYASILFKIYSDPATQKRLFEKTFMLHLQQISPSTRFPEALDILTSIDQNLFGSVNFDIIVNAFKEKGIQ